MARKMTRNNHVPASVASKSFAIDHSSRRGQSSRNHAHSDHTCIDNVETSQCERAGTGRSSARSSSSDDDADVSDADAAEADEEDDGDDDNGDALAPSGCAMNKHGNQAGRFKLVFKNGPLSSKKRRASSAGLESPDQNIKHARSSARNTTSYSEPSDSDDEAYNGVDLVSDANEDESDVEKFEEKGIIDSEDFNHVIPAFAVEDVGETTDGWEGFDLDNGFILPDIPYFAEQYGRNEPGILDSEIGIFQSASVFDDFEPITSPAARRVRFKEPVPPPSDSSDIVSNDEDLNGLFNTNEAPLQTNGDVTFGFENEDDASCVGNSSGYESGFLDPKSVYEANIAIYQLIMAIPLMKMIDFLRRVHNHFFASHRCLQWMLTRHSLHRQRRVRSRYIAPQLDIRAVHAWARGRSIPPSLAL